MKTIILGSVQYFFKYCLVRLAQENKELGISLGWEIQLKCFQGVF